MTESRKKALKDILIRSLKTFVEAFLSYLSADVLFDITDLNSLKKVLLSALLGALAAFITALWNALIKWGKMMEESDNDI